MIRRLQLRDLKMLDHIRDLLAHAEWANAVFFHQWGKTLARDQVELRRRVEHIIAVQDAFVCVLRNAPFAFPGELPRTFDELMPRAAQSHATLRSYGASMTELDLERTVTIPWFPPPPCTITTAQALVQVAMHSQHHRGQCMTRLRDAGGEPKDVDWIIWLWKGKPAARWE